MGGDGDGGGGDGDGWRRGWRMRFRKRWRKEKSMVGCGVGGYVDGWGWSLLEYEYDGGRLEEVRLFILGVVKRKGKGKVVCPTLIDQGALCIFV